MRKYRVGVERKRRPDVTDLLYNFLLTKFSFCKWIYESKYFFKRLPTDFRRFGETYKLKIKLKMWDLYFKDVRNFSEKWSLITDAQVSTRTLFSKTNYAPEKEVSWWLTRGRCESKGLDCFIPFKWAESVKMVEELPKYVLFFKNCHFLSDKITTLLLLSRAVKVR